MGEHKPEVYVVDNSEVSRDANSSSIDSAIQKHAVIEAKDSIEAENDRESREMVADSFRPESFSSSSSEGIERFCESIVVSKEDDIIKGVGDLLNDNSSNNELNHDQTKNENVTEKKEVVEKEGGEQDANNTNRDEEALIGKEVRIVAKDDDDQRQFSWETLEEEEGEADLHRSSVLPETAAPDIEDEPDTIVTRNNPHRHSSAEFSSSKSVDGLDSNHSRKKKNKKNRRSSSADFHHALAPQRPKIYRSKTPPKQLRAITPTKRRKSRAMTAPSITFSPPPPPPSRTISDFSVSDFSPKQETEPDGGIGNNNNNNNNNNNTDNGLTFHIDNLRKKKTEERKSTKNSRLSFSIKTVGQKKADEFFSKLEELEGDLIDIDEDDKSSENEDVVVETSQPPRTSTSEGQVNDMESFFASISQQQEKKDSLTKQTGLEEKEKVKDSPVKTMYAGIPLLKVEPYKIPAIKEEELNEKEKGHLVMPRISAPPLTIDQISAKVGQDDDDDDDEEDQFTTPDNNNNNQCNSDMEAFFSAVKVSRETSNRNLGDVSESSRGGGGGFLYTSDRGPRYDETNKYDSTSLLRSQSAPADQKKSIMRSFMEGFGSHNSPKKKPMPSSSALSSLSYMNKGGSSRRAMTFAVPNLSVLKDIFVGEETHSNSISNENSNTNSTKDRDSEGERSNTNLNNMIDDSDVHHVEAHIEFGDMYEVTL